MKNPIIDNRMVGSHTYAVRYLSFLSHLFPSDGSYPTIFTGPGDDEEFEYMCHVACNLVRYQVETCPDSEKWYFQNLIKDYKDGNDIIENFICKHNVSFLKFLRIIGAMPKLNPKK